MRPLFARGIIGAGCLALTLGAATCEQPIIAVAADFEAPQALALVCLHLVEEDEAQIGSFCPEDLDSTGAPRPNAPQFATVPLESCNLLNVDEFDPAENPTGTALPNSFLFLLATNVNRGEVAVVSLSSSATPQVLDSDASIPGKNFIPVGDFPRAIAVDPGGKRFVTANSSDNTLSIFENTDLVPCSSNSRQPPTIDLGGAPHDLAIDSNGIAYVTLPDSGELVAVDIRQSPARILGRADLRSGAPGPMRPTRIAISESRRLAFVSNATGKDLAEVNLDALVQGISEVNYIHVQSRTAAIAYLEPGILTFEGILQEGQQLPDPIDIPETLYVVSLDFVGQVLVVDVENKTLIDPYANTPSANEEFLQLEKPGPGIRVGPPREQAEPLAEIKFFTEPLLPIVGNPNDPNFIPRQDRPDNLQGVFALAITNNALAFVINVAPADPERRCCQVDGDPNVCGGTNTPPEEDGTCREGVFLPAQTPHRVRNTQLNDLPFIENTPLLFSSSTVLVNSQSAVIQRFPAIGSDDGCLGGEGPCGFDPNKVKIEIPALPDGVFFEDWVLIFEGVIPGTNRAGGRLTADSLLDDAAFCLRGIEPGDILQILSPQKPDAPPECQNLPTPPGVNAQGAFDPNGSPVDDPVTAELIVTAVENDRIFFAPREDVENPPADLSACYQGTVQYRLRVHDAFLVTGNQPRHTFMHRQIALPDGTCAVDSTIDARFSSRAVPGTIFANTVFRLELTNPPPPVNGQGVVASFRDSAWTFRINPGFVAWGIDPDISTQTGFSNIAGGLVITPDGTSAFISDINLDRIYELSLPNKAARLDPID